MNWRTQAIFGEPYRLTRTTLSAAKRVLLIFLIALPAAAARDLLAVGTHSEGVFVQGDDGRYAGLGADLLRLAARANGDTVHFAMYPWARALAMVVHGQADILIGPYKTARRETLMAYSRRPFYQDQIAVYALEGAPGSGRRPSTVRLALLNGRDYGADFERAAVGMPVIVTNDVDHALRMLAMQRVELFAASRRNAEPAIGRLGRSARIKPVAQLPQRHDGYFAYSKQPQADQLRTDFDAAFATLKKNGTIYRLARQYEVAIPDAIQAPRRKLAVTKQARHKMMVYRHASIAASVVLAQVDTAVLNK